MSDELLPGSGIRTVTVLPGSPVVAIDGETQVTAWHELYDNPERFGITYEKLTTVRLPYELYFGLTVEAARQIFYDRNVEGVPVAKNLAMSMDQRDIGTQLAHRIGETVKVEHDGRIIPFGKLVQGRKRQLTKSDPELITLSALRVLVITALHGRAGLALTSSTLHDDRLPQEWTPSRPDGGWCHCCRNWSRACIRTSWPVRPSLRPQCWPASASPSTRQPAGRPPAGH